MQESMRAGPYGYGRHEIVSALAGLGYARYGDPAPGTGRISPEELVACPIYSRDHRWISAVAVVLCRASIDWDRMVRLAVDYGFPGTLRGMIEAVRSTGGMLGVRRSTGWPHTNRYSRMAYGRCWRRMAADSGSREADMR